MTTEPRTQNLSRTAEMPYSLQSPTLERATRSIASRFSATPASRCDDEATASVEIQGPDGKKTATEKKRQKKLKRKQMKEEAEEGVHGG